MLWLIAVISSYLILAIVLLVDKCLISGPIPNPKVYTFYVGILGASVLIIAPFVGFYFPYPFPFFLSLLAGALFISALFCFFKALRIFEASRVVPAVGGLVPVFSLGLIYLFSKGKEILQFQEFLALIFLILGSVLITYKGSKISLKSFRFSTIAAFLLSLSFVLTKYVYLQQPFWNGFIWIRIGGVLMAIFFLFFVKEIRQKVLSLFKKQQRFKGSKKTAVLFISNQAIGAGAGILQNWAIFLAPLTYVALINALQGVQYLFLLIFVLIISLTWPFWTEKIGLKEEFSKKIIFQKFFAVLLIGIGLVLLAF